MADLRSFVGSVGSERFVRMEFDATPPWAALHDPEGHNVVCIEAAHKSRAEPGAANRGIPRWLALALAPVVWLVAVPAVHAGIP